LLSNLPLPSWEKGRKSTHHQHHQHHRLGKHGQSRRRPAVKGGNEGEVVSRDAAKAEALAETPGGGATAGTFGTAPAGDIVILAVPCASAVPVVAQCGNALAGKVIVDISNTITAAGHP
jgi:8-hydroxy-5-deazaflavin:NADPH oxidoreductase